MQRVLLLTLGGLVAAAVPRNVPVVEQYPPQYIGTPEYDRAMRLSDGVAMAELVVHGTVVAGEDSSERLQVHEILFGTVHEDCRGADGSLAMARIARVAQGKPGIWLLVRTGAGYLSVNPNVEPLELNEYRQLQRPDEHWTDQRDLVSHEAETHQLYHAYVDPETGRTVWHGPNSHGRLGREISVELLHRGERRLWVRWDRRGQIDRVARVPAKGHGFFLDYDGDCVVRFQHFRDRKAHGLERRYYMDRENPPRFERHFTDGVVDGRARMWDEDGKLVSEVTYESGLITPIVRYTGKGSSGIRVYRTREGVAYSASRAVQLVKVGMTTEQVSELLKVDFSPTSGIHFPTYYIDQYLHIAFRDGKVSAITIGHNGICIGPN